MEPNNFFSDIKRGNLTAVEEALDRDSALASVRDENGLSAVLIAVYYGQPAVARLLIKRGASLTVFEAAAAGETETVRQLIRQDPTLVNAFAPDGFQPLGLAAFFGHNEIAVFLLENGADPNMPSRNRMKVQPLNSAAAGQHLDIARALLEHGADPNAVQADDFTPLHSTAQNGQVEMARLLLEHGANPNRPNASGRTPRDTALDAGHPELAILLSA